MLYQVKLRAAVLAAQAEAPVNFTHMPLSSFATKVATTIRCLLSKFRDILNDKARCERYFSKCSKAESDAAQEMLSKVDLGTNQPTWLSDVISTSNMDLGTSYAPNIPISPPRKRVGLFNEDELAFLQVVVDEKPAIHSPEAQS